jgi:hypothetical protein
MTSCPHCGSTLPEPEPAQCPSCGALLGPTRELPLAPPPEVVTVTIPPMRAEEQQRQTDEQRRPTDDHAPHTGGFEHPPDPPLTGPPLAWEDRERLGVVAAFVETTRQVLTAPVAFFRRMPTGGGLGGPLLYAVAAGWIGIAAAAFYQAIWVSIVGPMTLPFGLERPELPSAFLWFESWAGLVAQVVFGGISVTIGAFVAAGLLHVMLMLLGGARGSFETTFRVVCYSQATGLLLIIPVFLLPFCGLFVVIWTLALYVVGLAEAHRIGYGTALGAVLLPVLAMCCCCGAFAFTLFGAIAGLARHAV